MLSLFDPQPFYMAHVLLLSRSYAYYFDEASSNENFCQYSFAKRKLS